MSHHRAAAPEPVESALKKNSTDKQWRNYVAKGVKRTEAKLKRAQEKASEEFDWEKTILEIAGDVSGITDIKNCIMEGDVTACAWTVAGIVGAAWTKIGKLVKGVRSAIKSFRAFQRGKKAAERQVTALTGELADMRSQLRALDRAADRAPTGAAAKAPARKPTASSKAPDRGSATKTKSSGDGDFCPTQAAAMSFSGDTLVLMGDRKTRKPISKIKVGDKVWAADPETGREGARRVTHTWEHRDSLVDLIVGDEIIITTEDHPFWSETDQVYKPAENFRSGELALTKGRLTPAVDHLDWTSARGGRAFNLTVADLNNYHVGRSAVLVHNCGSEGSAPSSSELSDLASEIRESGLHPAARNNRTFAVGTDDTGELFAGSSNGFDAGQRATLARLGVTRVRGSAKLHAEEELLREVPSLSRIGTSVRAPCGPSEHNCALQLAQRGVEIE